MTDKCEYEPVDTGEGKKKVRDNVSNLPLLVSLCTDWEDGGGDSWIESLSWVDTRMHNHCGIYHWFLST